MEKHPLRSPSLRRWYFTSLVSAMAVLFLVRLLVFPTTEDQETWRLTIGTLLDTLIAATVASLIIGLIYILLFRNDETQGLETIEAREIANTIKSLASKSRHWDVRARTANYFSSVTLPILTASALDSGRGCQIRIQMLDPENDRLMEAYARFRSNHPGQATKWSVDRVRAEIYGTVLQAALCKARAPRMDIAIGLSPAFWMTSIDLASDIAILTGQDKGEPALVFREQSPFFCWWQDDFEASFSECRILRPAGLALESHSLDSASDHAVSEFSALLVSMDLHKSDGIELQSILRNLGRDHHYA